MSDLRHRYRDLRARSIALAVPLSVEDQAAQSMPDASPTKWHLAHTSWFFETFLLAPHLPGYAAFDPTFGYLFNSYYEGAGPRPPRAERGLMTRPSARDVLAYRAHVDAAMDTLLRVLPAACTELVELGLAHEEQHQELILMDVLHLFSRSPLSPAYRPELPSLPLPVGPMQWADIAGGLVDIGAAGSDFAFDNETPRHAVFLQAYALADRLVSNGEWLAFIVDGGYRRAVLWLADGWATAQAQGWQAPLYWCDEGDRWSTLTLHGRSPLDLHAPVRHVSYYEADAYARWVGSRLPSEAEWEHAATTLPNLGGLYDQAWQWTRSAYHAYPGFRAPPGTVGEYNEKFMVGQMVLRGGSAITPPGHARATYRNFFAPAQRWMFSGVRLARDVEPAAPALSNPFLHDVVSGLSSTHKSLPAKYLYDAEGSRLFEAICATPEYYLTRTELALLRTSAADIARHIDNDTVLVEFGSGASVKTRILLDAAPQLVAYVPIDISASALAQAGAAIERDYPRLKVAALAADFTTATALPALVHEQARLGFFPGSTLGNFTSGESVALLAHLRKLLGPGAQLLIGVDLVKDSDTLLAAYDDAAGVTAAFNRNLLTRINRELGADFDPGAFLHHARWNASESRMEMWLVSSREQTVRFAGHHFHFTLGEGLHTEHSHKFTPQRLAAIAECAGWKMKHHWLDHGQPFELLLLSVS